MSRRDRLIPLNTTNNPPAQRPVFVTLDQLKKMQVRLPSQLANTGSQVMARVLADGSLEIGLVPNKEVPVLRSIEDVKKLSQARSLVAGVEAAAAKASVIEGVKANAASALIQVKEDPNPRQNTQVELLGLRIRSERLAENLDLIQKGPADQATPTVCTWIRQSIASITEFSIDNLLTSKTDDKLTQILAYNGVPQWIYQKFSGQKIPELASRPVLEVLFPRKLEKSFIYSWQEIKSLHFCQMQGYFMGLALQLRRFGILLETPAESTAKIFIPPPNFPKRVVDAQSFPQIGKNTEKITGFSIVLCRALCANMEPERVSQKTLDIHAQATYSGPQRFKFSVDDTRDMKSQYIEFYDKLDKNHINQVINLGFVRKLFSLNAFEKLKELKEEELPKLIFGVPNTEPAIKEIAEDIKAPAPAPQRQQGIKKALEKAEVPKGTFLVQPELRYNFDIFKCRDKLDSADAKAVLESLRVIRPAAPKERKYLVSSTLTPDGKRFVKDLEATAKAGRIDPMLATNVKAYLRSFYSQEFADLAVRLMRAAIQDRVIEPDDEETGDDGPDGGIDDAEEGRALNV